MMPYIALALAFLTGSNQPHLAPLLCSPSLSPSAVTIAPSGPQRLAATEEHPNVVIVLLDDVGRDKVGLYGVGLTPPRTPNIDALSQRGVLFENAWVYQSCSSTKAALLTRRYANGTGIGNIIRPEDGAHTPLALSEFILPEALPGYRSTQIGKWHLGDATSPLDHPLQHGFDAFVGWEGDNTYFDWVENLNGHLAPRSGYFPASMGGHASRAMHHGAEPFFLYYCPRLSHSPFHRPPSALHSYPPSIDESA